MENFDFKALVADRGYAMSMTSSIMLAVTKPSSPHNSCENPKEFDAALYKERTLVEQMFNKLTYFRRITPRYDTLAHAFLSFLHLAISLIMLK
ncbi:hypothetical protein HCUR_00639 [Holospora curviuscula]|uniref:Transposase DDE domain protein n=1 Tax=Holospora curviuscula TaxID=1082868 RepID=A0A2S5R956_9PROT|nr:hypothetical protein HCUR_00639 [Holospora curviuscula]